MNVLSNATLEPLSLIEEEHIDSVCLRFEQSWQVGQTPKLEQYLEDAADTERLPLLRWLLPLELHYRGLRGQKPAAEEYLRRFPGHIELVQAILAETFDQQQTPGSSETSGQTADYIAPADTFSRSGLASLLEPAQGSGELGRLGGFRILGVLGEGGMGTVLHGEDATLERSVAIKIMKPEARASDDACQRFLREARLAAGLDSPRIVPVYHAGQTADGVPYLVMPLLRGRSLKDVLLGDQPLPSAEVLRIGREMAEGLAAAHDAGLVHRDIKPANTWLKEPDGSVLLLDFGLARLQESAGELTSPGAVMGTPAYMAPEQANGQTVDFRADLFSLGCVLYQMATGQRPFQGTTTAVLYQLSHNEPTPIRQLNAAIAPELADLIAQLLAKRPEQRPASARAVAERLSAIEGRSAAVVPPGKVGEMPPGERTRTRPPQLVPTVSIPTLRRRWPTVAIAGGAVLAVGLLVVGLVLKLLPRNGGSVVVGPTGERPLEGELVVRVWGHGKKGLQVGKDQDAAPLEEDDKIQLEANLNQPAHVYLLWIDGKGKVTPLYPWNDDEIKTDSAGEPPPAGEPRAHIRNPSRTGKGWEVDETAGLDTFLLLARRTPWPADRSLAEVLGKTLPAPLSNRFEMVVRGWDRGQLLAELSLDQNRGPKEKAREIDDQLVQVVDRLRSHFELIRAVRVAHVPTRR